MTSTAAWSPRCSTSKARTSSRTASASHTARAKRCCIPSGVASPACSAIVQQFLRGRSASRPRTNALARRRRSTRANRPATRPSTSSNCSCQRAGSTSRLWPAATVRSLVVTTPDDQRWPPRSAHPPGRTRPARSRSTAGLLGRVWPDGSSLQPDQQRGDHDHGPVVDRPLLEAGRHRAELLEPVEAPLHHIATPVVLPVKGQRPTRPPGTTGALVRPLRDGVGNAAAAQQPPAGRVAVRLVADQMIGPLARPAPAAGTGHRDRVQNRLELGRVVPLTRGEHHAKRPAAAVAAQVELGGQPTPGAAERLGLVTDLPPLVSARAGRLRAPAACWWARTLLESTLTTHSNSPTASDLVWAWASSRSQVPSRRQRMKRS